jgi:hypothetical protein
MSEPKNCLICGKPIPKRAYQAAWARTCSPICASKLAHVEHPELEAAWGWRRQLAKLGAAG